MLNSFLLLTMTSTITLQEKHPTPFTSGTRIYRNHYGLIAESVYAESLFITMRRYNKDVVTSLNTIEKNEGGVMISHPENVSHTHLFTGTLTMKRLSKLHHEGVAEITRKLANIA